jgi:hypothetical protein
MNALNFGVKSKILLLVIFNSLGCFPIANIYAQEKNPISPFKVTADLVSQFVWRGSLATGGPTPNIQPTLAFVKNGLEIGLWGSTDFTGSYKEIDSYLFLSPGHFKVGITDYNWNLSQDGYFNYRNRTTVHRIEGTMGFTGTETMPVSITWNTIFYGLDKKPDDSTKQAYSTYIELAYSKNDVSLFFGFTPWSGFYNNYGITAFSSGARNKSFSIVNIGTSVTKNLKISEAFSLPLKATLVINPSATYSRNDYIHLVFGITF